MDNYSVDIHQVYKALLASGLDRENVEAWKRAEPFYTSDYEADVKQASAFFKLTQHLLEKLPEKPSRNLEQISAAKLLLASGRAARETFLEKHVLELYSRITQDYSRSVVVYDLPYEAEKLVPGLTPTREIIAQEATKMTKHKEGHEFDQGIFFAHVLAHEKSGLHLCHTMLLPGVESEDKLKYLKKHGNIDLGTVSIETREDLSWVTMKNDKFLNAEDATTLDPMDEAIDLAIMDPNTQVAVLRGDKVSDPKYNNRRAFCSGINLSHLYHGKIPYLWYMKRDLGFLHKIFRGLSVPGKPADDVLGMTREKLWISQVDSFAIGSGCQFLLPTDYIVAGHDAYLTLPACKEGIVPGVAELRLHRFVGDRMARQLIFLARRLDCATPEGQMICDEVVDPAYIEKHVIEAYKRITSSGMVAVYANRRAFRVSLEPLNLFREYMSVYAREQAQCLFSQELIDNLEMQKIATKSK